MKNFTGPTQRQLRVAEQVRQIVSNSFTKNLAPDPALIDISITVSMVKMSKDLKIAYIYIMPLGGENQQNFLENIKQKKNIFQRYLSKAKLKSKFTPKINFFIDDTFDEAEKIEKLLLNKKVQRDLNE